MFRTGSLVATLVLACVGCSVAPQPVYRAHPVQGSDFWANGVELAQAANDGIEVVLAFAESRGREIVFHVEVLNRSDQRITVDPAELYLVPTSGEGAEATLIFARDPETSLLQAELARSRALAREQSRTDTDLLFDFLEFGTDLATADAERTEEERQTEVLEEQEEELDDESRRQEHERTLRSLDVSRNRWAGKALRKTTLPPGFSIGGRVSFRAPEAPGRALVVVPVGEPHIRIAYEFERYDAGS